MYKDTHKKSSFGNIMEQKQDLFWKTKSLKEMTKAEWESLCDNCGRCCLHSVQDGKTGKIKLLAVACRHLDTFTCRCLVYKDRFKYEQDCEALSPDKIRRIKKGYIRISQPLNMLNIKQVKRFILISNARNSVKFCTIFPCAKDSS